MVIRMTSTLNDGKPVPENYPKHCADGGVEDLYGEDRASEDQLVTPWTFSVARFSSLSLIYNSFMIRFSFDCLVEVVLLNPKK